MSTTTFRVTTLILLALLVLVLAGRLGVSMHYAQRPRNRKRRNPNPINAGARMSTTTATTVTATCSRHQCTDTATKRLTLLRPDGQPSTTNAYCAPHCDELTGRLVPTYPGGRQAFTVEVLAEVTA